MSDTSSGPTAAERASTSVSSTLAARATNSSHVPSSESTGIRTMCRSAGSCSRSTLAALSVPRNSPEANNSGAPVRARMSVASLAV